MNTQQMLDMALNENLMLKNSLNIYADQANQAIKKSEAILSICLEMKAAMTEQVAYFQGFSRLLAEQNESRRPRAKKKG